jgi:acyl-CoA-binding protein
MTLQETFEKAVTDSKTLPAMPSNETLLSLYSLYKQSTSGDATGDGPSNPFDFVGRAKHEAWDKLRGLTTADAMQQYIDLVEGLKK